MNRKAFEGIKAFGVTYAGTANMFLRVLGMHGATIVRIESNRIPCVLRISGPFKDNKPGINRSEYFAIFNNDLYSLTLDLKHPKAQIVLQKLIEWADIFVENFTPGAMERAGLGYENLKRINPRIIMLSISQLGQTGPHRLIAGYGPLLQGLTGHDYLTGWPDCAPVLVDQSYPDFVAPPYATIAVLAALHYREKTGKGQYIDLSNYETCVEWLTPSILDYTVNKRIMGRRGNKVDYACPNNAYRCQGEDAWCAISVETEEEWRALCYVLGNLSWAADSRFSTLAARKENEDELDQLINQWTMEFTADEVMEKLQKAGVAAGKMLTCEGLYNNPQIEHRKFYRSLNHAEIGHFPYMAAPYVLSKTPSEIDLPAPLLGEHNEVVCSQLLGMSEEEYVELLLDNLFE
jgi:crotonobetainyl-CoA:carnitine CoA-transferase CaiB-like acyl-CoA transferase